MCRSNDCTSTSTHFVLFQSYLRQCLHRSLAASCSHALDSGPQCVSTASHALSLVFFFFCIFGSQYRGRTWFLVGNVDSRDLHRLARKFAGTGGRCSVSGQKMFIQRFRPHARSVFLHVTTPAFFRLAFALAVVFTTNARRFQRTHPLSGMESSLSASRDIGKVVTDFKLTCGSEPVMDAV